jgi:GNAT superfamily N-acetyltransferase
MQASTIDITTYTGAAIAGGLRDFQYVHATVFDEWPYLVESRPDEHPYIASYASLPRAALFVARSEGKPIGAATCLPLSDESANVQAPFIERGWDVRRFFYFGEGVILKEWRGVGLGKRLFALREGHARAVSIADYTIFCSVRRPLDHPLRPTDAVTNDAFWRKRGYQPMDGVACTMRWRSHGDAAATQHTLDFWIKSLNGAKLP